MMFKQYLQVTKPGIIFGNLISVIGGFLLASKGSIDYPLFIYTLVGVSLVVASGCVFNNYIDRDIDRKMERTKNRVLVKGLIEEMASAYEDPKEVIEFYSKNKELMDNMRNVALEEQAVEAVLAKAKVTEKETTFNELMNQQA